MRLPKWMRRSEDGASLEMVVTIVGMKDMERMERKMHATAQHFERAARASEKMADACERMGLRFEVDE